MVDMDDDRRRGPRRNSDSGLRSSGGRRERGARGRTEYCPEGKCFDYKDVDTLKRFIGETGKIKPRRQTGCCARCQRELAREVKRARHLALLPFVDNND
ncbi:30S ribosomal protein S18 [Aggregatilineales bacterium SYSU G02658]